MRADRLVLELIGAEIARLVGQARRKTYARRLEPAGVEDVDLEDVMVRQRLVGDIEELVFKRRGHAFDPRPGRAGGLSERRRSQRGRR